MTWEEVRPWGQSGGKVPHAKIFTHGARKAVPTILPAGTALGCWSPRHRHSPFRQRANKMPYKPGYFYKDKRDTQQSAPDTGLNQDCLQATRTVVTLLMGHPSIRVEGPGSQDSRLLVNGRASGSSGMWSSVLPGSLAGQREGGRGGRRWAGL